MAQVVATAAVVAVALLSLLALWRAVRSVLALSVDDDDHRVPAQDQRLQMLIDERTRHLRAIKEIEFDYDTGKISENDYRQLRGRHELGAAAAMRALDELHNEVAR